MFEAHAERFRKLPDNLQCCIGILNVIVRKFLTSKLFGKCHRIANLFTGTVERGLLVGILAIAEALHCVEREEEFFVEARSLAHIGGNVAIVESRMSICLSREHKPCFGFGVTTLADFSEHEFVVVGVAHNAHRGEVLGSRAQHRRATDVDILHSLLHSYALFGDGSLKGIEVYADHIDGLYAVLGKSRHMLFLIPTSQQTTVHLGVQGLNSALANLGKARNIADVRNLQSTCAKCRQSTTRGDNLPTHLNKGCGKLNHSPLIANAN